MKELSIAGKATRYDEALKEAVIAHKDEDRHLKATLERIFPELEESEDERIRKELLNYLYDVYDDDEERARWIAWLEKQGEIIKEWSEMKFNNIQKELQEMVDLKHKTEQGEQKPVEKDESKFKVGDWVVDNYGIVKQILSYKDGVYKYTNGYSAKIFEDEWRLWDITKDAKDGDVLCTYECGKPKIVFILKGSPKKHYALSYHCYYNIMYPHFVSDSEKGCLAPNDEDVKPATKEQRDTLEIAMINAGYIFDFEKKELKKIEQKPADKVEPKFKVSDKIKYSSNVYDVLAVKEHYYVLSDDNVCEFKNQDKWQLVEQNPADVSKQEDIELTEFEDALYTTFSDIWQDYMLGKEINVVDFVREHSDELLKIANKQKPTEWSEEDESRITTICTYLQDYARLSGSESRTIRINEYCDWLKSLKDRVQPQPKQELSGEDEKMLEKVIKALSSYADKLQHEGFCHNKDVIQEYIDWLKKKGEQKPTIVPKFRVGDTIRVKDSHAEYTIDSISDGLYHGNGWFLAIGKEDDYELVEHKSVGEEDERIRKHLIKILEEGRDNITLNRIGINACIDWLKSLRPQSQWKPSKEQMETLEYYMHTLICNKRKEILFGLYTDLKKLREE